MNCIHGIRLERTCAICISDFGTNMRRYSESQTHPSNVSEKHTCDEVKPDDRLANELASLTLSIQSLSGNVAKLVEDRPRNPMAGNYGPEDGARLAANLEANGFSKVAVSPLENFSVEGLIDELSRRGYVLPLSRHVKRGPVTDDEVKNLMATAGMVWGPKGVTSLRYKFMMQKFAKSRGLID